MDLVLRAHGLKLTDGVRRAAQHKLAKLERLNPRIGRVEVDVIGEHNPSLGEGSHRVKVSCLAGRRIFRAQGAGRDFDSALDQVVDRLERQLTSARGKLRARLVGRSKRLQSRWTSPEDPAPF